MRRLSEHEAMEHGAFLEHASPEDRLAWAVDTWGERLLFTSSFGATSAVLLHMWSRVAGDLPVVFIDTGFLFEETNRYKDELASLLGLRVKTVRPELDKDAFLAEWGSEIYLENPDFCCNQNRVEPLRPLVADADAWISGLRRDQGPSRADTPILLRGDDGVTKVHPLATMTSAEVSSYMSEHALPKHPLRARGYASIGCAPCTRPTREGADNREGRWSWTPKTECGLHTNLVRPAASLVRR
jgi:phosphoadenosine phosphosulfate reductase